MSTPSDLTFAQKHSLPFANVALALTAFLSGLYRGTNVGEACALLTFLLLSAIVNYHYWYSLQAKNNNP